MYIYYKTVYKMELLTDELKKVFEEYPLYSQEDKEKDSKVICKYFFPSGRATFYATEGQPQEDGDFLFFGYVVIFEGEFGYFTLSQLEEIKIPVEIEGLGSGLVTMERDLYFPIAELTVSEALKEDGRE